MKHRANKRALASALALCLLLIAVLSASYISGHLTHDCAGEDCAICVQIGGAHERLRQLAGALLVLLLALAALALPARARFRARAFTGRLDPVFIKVRMNN